jgi:hypothetical protein
MSMTKEISSRLSITFFIHMIVSGILGAALWLIPGRTLSLLGWVEEMVLLPESELSVPGYTFVDPLITRLMGAALLALAFSSFQGWRSKSWSQVRLVVELETAFTFFGVVAFIAVLALGGRNIPPAFWALFGMMAAFMIAWGIALLRRE